MISKSSILLAAATLALSASQLLAADAARTRIAIEDFAIRGNYAEATALSDQLLEQVAAESGADSAEFADSLLLLADVGLQAGEPLQAAARISDAADLFESLTSPEWSDLIRSYLSLGNVFSVRGEFDLARGAYEEARNLSRRSFGLLNLNQLEVLALMSRNALAAGDFEGATEIQRERVILEQRYYGADSLEYFEAEMRFAEWLDQTGQYGAALSAYHDLYNIVRRNFDDDPELRVRTFQATARSKRMSGRVRPTVPYSSLGGGAGIGGMRPVPISNNNSPTELKRALKVIDDMDDPDPGLHAAVFRDIGDWQVAAGRFEDAREAYIESWQILEGVEGGQDLLDEWFFEPVVIRQFPLMSPVLSIAPGAPEGYVAVVFTVDSNGRATDIRVVDSSPPGLLDNAAARQVGSALYRPRMLDGELLPTSMQTIHRFQYDPEQAARYSAR